MGSDERLSGDVSVIVYVLYVRQMNDLQLTSLEFLFLLNNIYLNLQYNIIKLGELAQCVCYLLHNQAVGLIRGHHSVSLLTPVVGYKKYIALTWLAWDGLEKMAIQTNTYTTVSPP